MFGPPVDLTGLPGYREADLRPRRTAFIGRVSTKDNQNPATSIPRQVLYASALLEPGEEFAAHFWDVESGLLPPEKRGLGPLEMYAALEVPTPRDGGLTDLVERAAELGITHVAAERSDRLARAMLTSLVVEHELEKAGIAVLYANEPTGGTKSGQLRMRRYGQAEAEIYLAVMKEMSTGGQVQHAINGWNHGYPPYPYIAVVDENAPRQQGGRLGPARPKKKLAPHPDPRRFDASRELCRLRREEYLKGQEIVAVLAADPERYPIDGEWTFNRVEGLIANPKLTGHQVYNRKATRTGRPGGSRLNPISQWVWSPHVTHEPVVSVEEWREAQEVTAGLRADAEEFVSQRRFRDAVRGLGLDAVMVRSGPAHVAYRVGDRQVVVPRHAPEALVRQVVGDLEVAR